MPPLLLHFLTPAVQFRDDECDLRVLIDCLCLDFCRVIVTELRVRQLLHRMIGVKVDALAKLLQHLDGRA